MRAYKTTKIPEDQRLEGISNFREKNQMTIDSDIADLYGLKPGDKIYYVVTGYARIEETEPETVKKRGRPKKSEV